MRKVRIPHRPQEALNLSAFFIYGCSIIFTFLPLLQREQNDKNPIVGRRFSIVQRN